MNYLIIVLFIVNLIMTKNKWSPKGQKLVAWGTIILFSYHWGTGGLLEFPMLANIAGFVIIMFWMVEFLFSFFKLCQNTLSFFLKVKRRITEH